MIGGLSVIISPVAGGTNFGSAGAAGLAGLVSLPTRPGGGRAETAAGLLKPRCDLRDRPRAS